MRKVRSACQSLVQSTGNLPQELTKVTLTTQLPNDAFLTIEIFLIFKLHQELLQFVVIVGVHVCVLFFYKKHVFNVFYFSNVFFIFFKTLNC